MEKDIQLINSLAKIILQYEANPQMAKASEEFQRVLDMGPSSFLIKLLKYTTKKVESENTVLFANSCCCIDFLISSFDPVEILIDFIEITEQCDYVTFSIATNSMLKCLRKLQRSKFNYFFCCLNSILNHLDFMEVPEDLKLEGDEKKLLESDFSYIEIENVYWSVIKFFDELGLKLNCPTARIVDESDIGACRRKLKLSILQSFGKPLAYSYLEDPKSNMFSVAMNLVKSFSNLEPNFLSHLDFEKSVLKDEIEDPEYSKLSLGVFFYLVFAKKVYIDRVPNVYSPSFIWEKLTILSISLFNMSHSLIQWKGLALSNSLLDFIDERYFNFGPINDSVHCKFCETLPALMVHSQISEVRQLAAQVFKRYILRLNSKGRYIILLKLSDVFQRPEFIGFLITIIKEIIHNYLSLIDEGDKYYFSGRNLKFIIFKYCCLKNGKETDLLENSNQIVSSLNLLRYLILKDVNNVSGIWNYFNQIEKSFLTVLQQALQISKAEFKLKLEEETASKEKSQKLSLDIVNSNEKVFQLSKSERCEALSRALTTFDLIESILARLNYSISLSKNIRSAL